MRRSGEARASRSSSTSSSPIRPTESVRARGNQVRARARERETMSCRGYRTEGSRVFGVRRTSLRTRATHAAIPRGRSHAGSPAHRHHLSRPVRSSLSPPRRVVTARAAAVSWRISFPLRMTFAWTKTSPPIPASPWSRYLLPLRKRLLTPHRAASNISPHDTEEFSWS